MRPSTKAIPAPPDSRRPGRLLLARPIDEKAYNKPGSKWFKIDGEVACASEIESVIEAEPSVSEVAVTYRNYRLVAFFTTIAVPRAHYMARIRAAIRAELPPHAQPTHLIRLQQMPIRDGEIDRARLGREKARLKRSPVKIPRVADAENSWSFEGVIEAAPSAATLLVSHFPHANCDARRPIKVVIHRTKLHVHMRLTVGWYGVFEGYFGRGGAMLATKARATYLPPRPPKLSSPEKALAAF